jgi:cysteine desulfurase
VQLSHVLAAMKVTKDIGRSAVRLTLGRQNTAAEMDTAAKMIVDAYRSLRGESS